MGAQENLERMLALADERLARGELVNTPEQIAAQEHQRYTAAIFPGPSGEFEPVKNRKLKRQTPFYPSSRKAQPKKSPPQQTPSKAPPKPAKSEGHWAKLKASVIAERGLACERCGAHDYFPLLTRKHWRRKGRELPEDVELLCKGCFYAKYPDKGGDKLDREYQAVVRDTSGLAPWED
jgi:hypothetical protein